MEQTVIRTHEGPIFIHACEDVVSMSVNINCASVHTFLTPGEVDNLIAALTDAKGRVK